MHNKHWFLWTLLGALLLALTACSSSSGDAAVAQAPPRRGNIDIAAQVRSIIADTLGTPEEQITAGANIYNDLGVDETTMRQIADALEQALGISITEEEIQQVTTVQSLIDLVQAKSP